MIRHDTVVELLQQRQEKDIQQLNKVSTHIHTYTSLAHDKYALSLSLSLSSVPNRVS